jgi:DNA-binding CsgD family transcriptional regulator
MVADMRRPLTQRQEQTLALVGRGLTLQEIGDAMGISASGARQHVQVLCHKFGVDHKRQLIPIAQDRKGNAA